MSHIGAPIFIIGIMERSGTNFLADVLQSLDPNFQVPSALGEDFLLEHSHLLNEYASLTHRRWQRLPWLNNPDQCKQMLLLNLGEALLKLLYDQIGENRRLLAKTPGAYNLNKFFHLFPQAKLVVLIRDGRDVAESAASTWPDEPLDYWIRRWAEGARLILGFKNEYARQLPDSSWLVVRYEDLAQKPEAILPQLTEFLAIDGCHTDWHQIKCLPVRGSSQHRDAAGNLKWAAIEKDKTFNPIGRWSNWTWRQKRKFKKLAGRELIELGYVPNHHW